MENYEYPTSGDSVTREAGNVAGSFDHFDDAAFDPTLLKDQVGVDSVRQQAQPEPTQSSKAEKVQFNIEVVAAPSHAPVLKIFNSKSVFQELLPNQKTLSATTLHFFANQHQKQKVECWKICNRISGFLQDEGDQSRVSMSVRGTTLCVTKFDAEGGVSCGAMISPFVDLKSNRFAIEFRRDHGSVDAFGELYHGVREHLEGDPSIPLQMDDANSDKNSTTTCPSLDSLDLNVDWIPDDLVSNSTHVRAQDFYELANTGGDIALEAAQMLSDEKVEFDDTSCAEFWMALKLLLASQRDAVVMPVLKYAISESEKANAQLAADEHGQGAPSSSTTEPQEQPELATERKTKKAFGIEFVEVGLGREVADVFTFEESGLLLVRKAGDLLKVLAESLWMAPKGKQDGDADLKLALTEFHEVLLEHEADLPQDNEAKRNFYQCFTTVKEMLAARGAGQ